jgi:signal transduction histidine kinase
VTFRSPRWRILLLCALVALAALAIPLIAAVLLQIWREVGPSWCERPMLRAPDDTDSALCAQLFRRPSLVTVFTQGSVLLVVLAACWPAVRWCLQPLRDVVPVIANVGPQNLGHRLNPGAGSDELVVLGRTIDEMMDRIAVGYEAQRRFAADASHELRTPLAVQRTLIEVGMSRDLGPEQLELLAAQLLDTNARNERLIEGLLVLSESDRGLVSRAPLRLDEITAAVLDAYAARATEAEVTITRTLRPRVVTGEQVLLERLVGNLVENALKYNRPGGTLDVEVGDDPALVVANTGDDIPPEQVAALFEPFRRRQSTRIDHSGGAGLGLTITRSITRAHDGVIAASSTGRDGLRVQISFPQPGTADPAAGH